MRMQIGLAVVAMLCVGAGCVGPKSQEKFERPKHVVFVGFDGLSAWCVKEHLTEMPTLKRMMDEGSWTFKSRSILPSSSACNWRSIFTCSASEQHGFTEWNSKKPVFTPAETMKSGLYPDLLAVLREQRPSAQIALGYVWGGIAFVADTNVCDFVANTTDEALGALSEKVIRERRPDFFAAVFDQPDHTGHGKGWGSEEYVAWMSRLDGSLAGILKAIDAAGIADETVVVVSSDHGGIRKGHGHPTLEEMERPLVIWGKGVRKGHEVQASTTVYDTGATLAELLGLDFPQAWIGRPVVEAFAD